MLPQHSLEKIASGLVILSYSSHLIARVLGTAVAPYWLLFFNDLNGGHVVASGVPNI
jgi:hypothetical protein